MEVLNGAIDSFFKEIHEIIKDLNYQVNHNMINYYTLDTCIHFLNNLLKLEESLNQRKTDIDLALLSVSNTKRVLNEMQKEFQDVLSKNHSG